jgi:hypothetical protein
MKLHLFSYKRLNQPSFPAKERRDLRFASTGEMMKAGIQCFHLVA